MSIFKKYLVGFLFLGAMLLSTSAQAQLPPEAKAKLLDRQIVSAIKAEDLSKADDLISEYQTLGVSVPATYLFIQAKIANSNNDYFKSKIALESYFNSAGTAHSKYDEALTLYELVDPKVKDEQDRQAAIAREEHSRRDAEAKRLADIEAKKQAVLDRGNKLFMDSFSDLEDLVEGYDPSRKDEKTYLRVSQSLYGAVVSNCEFKYSRNVSKSSKGRGNIPSGKSGNSINVSTLLGRLIQSKRFEYSHSYKVKSSLPDGRGNWVDTSYRQTDEVSIRPTMLGELMLSSSYSASTAKEYLGKMQEGCDIVSGKTKPQIRRPNKNSMPSDFDEIKVKHYTPESTTTSEYQTLVNEAQEIKKYQTQKTSTISRVVEPVALSNLNKETRTCNERIECLKTTPSTDALKIKNLCAYGTRTIGSTIEFNYKDENRRPKQISVGIPATIEMSFDNEIPFDDFGSYTILVRNTYGQDRCEVKRQLTPRLR